MPLIIREYLDMIKGIANDPIAMKKKSVSHVFESLKALALDEELPFPEEPMLTQLTVLATQRAAMYIKSWADIHSIIGYMAGYHIWDVIMAGASVYFQHQTHRSWKAEEEIDDLDTIRPALLTKLFLSSKSPLVCTIKEEKKAPKDVKGTCQKTGPLPVSADQQYPQLGY